MIYPVVLLSENYMLFSNDYSGDPANRVHLSLLLHGNEEQKLKDAYRYISKNNQIPFSLTLSTDQPVSDLFIQAMVSFLFIPGYSTVSNKKLITVTGTIAEQRQNVIERISRFSAEQGIEHPAIVQPVLHPHSTRQEEFSAAPPGQLFFTAEDLAGSYTRQMENMPAVSQVFYLQDPMTARTQLYSIIQSAEKMFSDKHPAAFRLAIALQTAVAESGHWQMKFSAAENEVKNYQLHLEVLRSSHEAKQLQAYYDREYETLPLWYKRFGHIIKVMMGKRSFRSLFYDNIKKYKD